MDKNMFEIPVYICGYHTNYVSLTKGEALDRGYSDDEIRKGVIVSPLDVKKMLEECDKGFASDIFEAYRVVNTRIVSLYVKSEDADSENIYYIERKPGMVRAATFYWDPTYTVLRLPVLAYFKHNDRGAFTRMHTFRPDLYGFQGYARCSKLFFLDRKCKNQINDGWATITAVTHESDKYGFVIADQLKLTMPTEESIAEYLKSLTYLKDTYTLKFVHSYCNGEYVVLANQSLGGEFTVLSANSDRSGCVTITSGMELPAQVRAIDFWLEGEVTEECSVADFLCEGYLGCKYSELADDLVAFSFLISDSKECNTYISDAVQKAVDLEFVTIYRSGYTLYARYDTYRLLDFVRALSPEEVDEVIDTCNALNEKANARVYSMAKSGKIKIQ